MRRSGEQVLEESEPHKCDGLDLLGTFRVLVGLAGFFGGPGTLQEYQGAFGPPGQVEAGSLCH